MQNQKSSKKTAKSSLTCAQRDLKHPLISLTQCQGQLQTVGSSQKPLKSSKFTNLSIKGENMEQLESPHCGSQAQHPTHLLKVIEPHLKHSNTRVEGISSKYTAESTRIFLKLGEQLRGGGDPEETLAKEAQNQHLTSLLHKIDEYRTKIQNGKNFENILGTYIKPFELEFEIKKRLLNSDATLKVVLLTGGSGIGKSTFCKYLQRAMLVDWDNTQLDDTEWLPILVDLSNLKEAANFTISEALKQELSLTENEIKLLQESEGNMHRLPRFLFIFDEYDQMLQIAEKSANSRWTLEDCIQKNFCNSVSFEAFWNHAKILITVRRETLSRFERTDLLFGPLQRSNSVTILNSFAEFELQPLAEDQISLYLKKYIVSNNIGQATEKDFQILLQPPTAKSWGLVENIQNAIDSFGMRGLTCIPLNLFMIIQVLPGLLKNSEAKKTGDRNMGVHFAGYQRYSGKILGFTGG